MEEYKLGIASKKKWENDIVSKKPCNCDQKLSNDCNWTQTHSHLVRTQTLNHLAKLASLAK